MRRLIASLVPVLIVGVAAMTFAVPRIEAGGGGYAGCAHAPREGAREPVVIKDYCFTPAVLRIEAGETVTWTNEDAGGHNVTMFDGKLLGDQNKFFQGDQSGLLQGESLSYTFDAPGLYPYYCSIHPWMIGVVSVGDPASYEASAVSPSAAAAASGASGGLAAWMLGAGVAVGAVVVGGGIGLYRRVR